MPSILDSRAKIGEIDKSNLLGSVEAFPDQILDALAQTESLVIPESYKSITNIVVSGMGGSALGSHVVKSLFKKELTVPFEIVSHYELPAYTSENTLVLLSSYSGTTEETLAAGEEAIALGAKIVVIASGGELADFAKKHDLPIYLIKVSHNPSDQPRMATGYSITAQLVIFAKLGVISDQSELLKKTAQALKNTLASLSPESELSPAKLLAFAAFDKHTIFVAAEHVVGAAHLMNNQFNENAKAMTSEWHLPEFNHHYMEALSFPKLARDTSIFMLFNSGLYHPRLQKRVLVTKDLLEQKGYEVQFIQATAPTRLEQVFEIILLGEYVACYLPILYGIDPAAIPNVDWFKSEMSK